jgi:hypothetical protein
MKILTLGDSFTYGEELENLSNAWPYLLSQYADSEVVNLARPSKGNSFMVRECITNGNNFDLVVIAWSHFARIEFSDQEGTYDIWPGSNPNVFSFHTMTHRKELSAYITRYYSDDYLYNQYLVNVLSAQNYLKQHQVNYVFLDAFGNNQSRQLGNPQLQKQVDTTYFIGWPDKTMMEWTYGYPKGPGGHFLDQGHQQVAEKINEHIRNLGWVS